MEEQCNRVYYEIIDEVCNKLIEEGQLYEIDRATVYGLQTEWMKNLDSIRNESIIVDVVPTGQRESGGLVFSDEEDLESSYSAEDAIDKLEKSVRCYMMCLYVKVAKSKNKWKCNFKQGFINIDNDDIPFSSANGELDW